MDQKETVYRIRYTADNRIKSVHVTDEPKSNEQQRTAMAWLIIVAGVIACIGWWLLWV